jgi:lambda family phage tail tape measure protein
LGVIAQTSKDLNVPIAASTRQFTTLSASVLGAGGTIQDAELVFTGVSNAIKATGGNAEDVQSAIRAMSQIFGKGKVSAEELQGQLGERLAGAVVKFAEANGSSLAKLQKDLRDGTVGLDQVIKFAEKLNVDFAETAKTVANSSADAGQRLAKQMDDMKLAVGTAVLPIGAAFQQAFGDIVTGITNSEGAMDALTTTFKVIGAAAFATFAAVRFLTRSLVDMAKILYHVANLDFQAAFNVMKQGFKDTADTAKKDFEALANIDIFGTKAEKDKNKPKKVSYPVYVGGKPVNQPSGLATLTDGGEGDKDFDKNLQKNIDFIQKARDAEKKAEDEKYTRFLDFQLLSSQITQQKFDQIEIDREALKISEDLGINLEYVKEVLTQAADKSFNFAEEFAKISEKATDLKSRVGELALDVTDRLGNAFADFFTTGKMGFADLARSAIQELNRIIIKAAFMKFVANPILGALNLNAKGNVFSGGEVVPSAKGNVFAQNKIVPYAYGGIVSKPTLFPMANGAGLMGEAGPEAIMPLKRGRNGKLGVIAQGGGVGNIVVNVDASGSSVEGNSQQSAELGRMLGAVVQAELIKQKRPGGLLG